MVRAGQMLNGNKRQSGQEITNDPTFQDKVLQHLEKMKLRNRPQTVSPGATSLGTVRGAAVTVAPSPITSTVIGRIMGRIVGVGH